MKNERYIELRNHFKNDFISLLFNYYTESGGHLKAPEFYEYIRVIDITLLVKELDVKHEVTVIFDINEQQFIKVI